MKLTWNIVTRNIQPHTQLQDKLRQKIAKLERHLLHFPPDAVHLQITLARHVRRPTFLASLTLRVPSNILHAEKSAPDPIPAFDHAMKALLRELSSLKAELRRESWWHRAPRPSAPEIRPAPTFTAEPLPVGQGPQTFSDSVSDLLQRHYDRLVSFVERRLEQDSQDGVLATRTIEPQAVVNEVTRKALASPERKPDEASYLAWFYLLTKRELAGRYRALRGQEGQALHIEIPTALSLSKERSEGYDVQRPREIIEQQFEPTLADTADLMVDPHGHSPDEVVEHEDFVRYLSQAAGRWPKLEREVFELHYLEGLELDEIALIEKQSATQIQRLLAQVQDHLRLLVAAAAAEDRGVRMPAQATQER